ncbi:MAG TPA: toxin-antitoxin system HicB family antitoxin [bacterium]|nr:toxin-antitoxin system HicB family antitoxin [bacterium]
MKKRTLKGYRELPYTRELVQGEDGWVAKIKELPGCLSQGDTAEEALKMIDDAMAGWLEVALESGDEIPLPESMQENYSGRFALRMPKTLHKELAVQAAAEGVSLNTFIVTALAERNPMSRIRQLIESRASVSMVAEKKPTYGKG